MKLLLAALAVLPAACGFRSELGTGESASGSAPDQLGGFGGGATGAGGSTVPGGPWPQANHDSQGTRRSPADSSANQGKLAWSYAIEALVPDMPVIGADGTVYAGSYDGNLYAIGPPALGATGVLRWKFQTGDGSDWVVAAPAVAADGTVYVGSDDGNVYAIGPPRAERPANSSGASPRATP